MGAADDQQLGKGVIRGDAALYPQTLPGKSVPECTGMEQFSLHPNYLSRLFKGKDGKKFRGIPDRGTDGKGDGAAGRDGG